MNENLQFSDLISLKYFHHFLQHSNVFWIVQLTVRKFAQKINDFIEIRQNFRILLKDFNLSCKFFTKSTKFAIFF